MGHPLRLAPPASLFGLAPCGVLRATDVATGAVRSYRTFSPLPASALAGFGAAGLATHRWLYVFCATVLQVTLTGRYPAHCPPEFGLSSPPSPAYAGLGEAIVWLTATKVIIAWGERTETVTPRGRARVEGRERRGT